MAKERVEAMSSGPMRHNVHSVITLLEQFVPALAKAMDERGEHVVEIRVKFRDDGAFLIVRALSDDDGGPVIKFANAHDLDSVLIGLNQMMANRDGWREDKPFSPVPLPKESTGGKLSSPRTGKGGGKKSA